RGDADPHVVTAAAARLSVSRSRERVQAAYDTGPGALPFPERAAGEAIRVGTAPDVQLQELVTGVGQLEAGGEAAALFRLLLLSQLASSLPAFRTSLEASCDRRSRRNSAAGSRERKSTRLNS